MISKIFVISRISKFVQNYRFEVYDFQDLYLRDCSFKFEPNSILLDDILDSIPSSFFSYIYCKSNTAAHKHVRLTLFSSFNLS